MLRKFSIFLMVDSAMDRVIFVGNGPNRHWQWHHDQHPPRCVRPRDGQQHGDRKMHDSGTGAAGCSQTLERSDCADWVPMIDGLFAIPHRLTGRGLIG
jgi:hypothetical protein